MVLASRAIASRIRELVVDYPDLAVIAEPLLIARRVLREQFGVLHRRLLAVVREDEAAIFLWMFVLPFGKAGALLALGWSSCFNSFQLGDDHDAGHRLFDHVDNHGFFGNLSRLLRRGFLGRSAHYPRLSSRLFGFRLRGRAFCDLLDALLPDGRFRYLLATWLSLCPTLAALRRRLLPLRHVYLPYQQSSSPQNSRVGGSVYADLAVGVRVGFPCRLWPRLIDRPIVAAVYSMPCVRQAS
jgi:hypothetical protein